MHGRSIESGAVRSLRDAFACDTYIGHILKRVRNFDGVRDTEVVRGELCSCRYTHNICVCVCVACLGNLWFINRVVQCLKCTHMVTRAPKRVYHICVERVRKMPAYKCCSVCMLHYPIFNARLIIVQSYTQHIETAHTAISLIITIALYPIKSCNCFHICRSE